MQIKSRLFRFLTAILLAACGIVSLLVLEIFGTTSGITEFPVPEKAEWMVHVDASSILKEELYAVFFEAKDEQLLRSIRELLVERAENKSEHPPLYINFRSDMVFYGVSDGQADYLGVLLQLEKAEVFQRNIPVYLKKGQTVAVKGNTALLLIRRGKTTVTTERQQAFTNTCLNGGTKHSVDRKNDASNEWINIQDRSFGDGAKDLNMGVLFEKHALRLKGTFTFSGNEQKTPAYSLKSSGLFLSTSIVPAGLADTINKLLPLGSYHFPQLQAVTLDYNGAFIENTDQGLKALPKLNAIFEGKVPVSVTGIRASVPEMYLGPHNTIIFSSMTYYMKQLDEHTVFIGLDTHTILRQPQSSLLRISGSLKPLVDIKGSRMIVSLMEIIVPQIRSARTFIAKTERIDLVVTHSNGRAHAIGGKLRFSENAYAMNELTRLLVSMKIID